MVSKRFARNNRVSFCSHIPRIRYPSTSFTRFPSTGPWAESLKLNNTRNKYGAVVPFQASLVQSEVRSGQGATQCVHVGCGPLKRATQKVQKVPGHYLWLGRPCALLITRIAPPLPSSLSSFPSYRKSLCYTCIYYMYKVVFSLLNKVFSRFYLSSTGEVFNFASG